MSATAEAVEVLDELERLADLAEGLAQMKARLGWESEGASSCRRVPSLTSFTIPPSMCSSRSMQNGGPALAMAIKKHRAGIKEAREATEDA